MNNKKTRKKRSIVWKVDKDVMSDVVKSATTIKEILNHFGIDQKGGNYRTLKDRLDADNIDYSHITLGSDHNKGKRIPKESKPLSEVMIENSTYCRSTLKRRLLNDGLIENKCSICELDGEWNGQPVNMVLDHINGVSNDHRLENLRMVCPNCNSQLPTHCGKHKKRKINNCIECGKVIHNKSQRCISCSSLLYNNNDIPTKDQLLIDLRKTSFSAVGRKYGVSDNAVRKWCVKYGLPRTAKEIKKL
jgi:hypothetical protein